MLQCNQIRDAKEKLEMQMAAFPTGDSLKIEDILRRAHEIHRQHGGVFGYDFEDWAQAWGELPQSGSARDLQFATGSGPELLRELERGV